MNLNNQKSAWYILLLPFLLFSCGGGNDDDPIPPPEPPVITEGNVTITPQTGEGVLPALQYRFYNTDGKTACKVLSCDGKGNFSGKLPLGGYRVIAANTSASGVVFKDMDSHTGASVHLSPVVDSRAGLTIVSQPGKVYTVMVDNVSIAEADNGTHKPVAVSLTKTIEITFTLLNGLGTDVTGIKGVLQGVYPSVSLFTNTPVSSVEGCANVAVGFESTGADTQRKATITLFGICDPKGGVAYTNILSLTLTMTNGETEELGVDLTTILSDAISGNQNLIPDHLQIPVQLSRTSIGLGATVGNWVVGGESEKEMEN